MSQFSRVNITDEQVTELRDYCKSFFRGYCLFFNVNPTIWTLGNVVPLHVEQMKAKYGLGLGLNSMEGREAKHIAIARYSQNTVYHHRWEQIFQHEYISLIWLREKGYNTNQSSVSAKPTYLPKRVVENPEFCICGLEKRDPSDTKCRFCSDTLRSKIMVSIEKCKILI